MESIDEIKLQNRVMGAKVSGPVGVFIGATAGIGEHSAYTFAKYSNNPSIHIVGRNKESGQRVIAQCKEINPDGVYTFHSYDMSLVKNVDTVCEEIKGQETKINSLCISSGSLNLNLENNEEGLNATIGLVLYGRWRAVEQLMPLVQQAAKLFEPARVLSILDTTRMAKLDDSMMSGEPAEGGLAPNATHWATLTNLLTCKYARLYPTVSMIHNNPGFVRTNLVQGSADLGWILKTMLTLTSPFLAETPEVCGERMYFQCFASDKFQRGPYLLNTNGMGIKCGLEDKGLLGVEDQDRAYKFLHDKFETARASN